MREILFLGNTFAQSIKAGLTLGKQESFRITGTEQLKKVILESKPPALKLIDVRL